MSRSDGKRARRRPGPDPAEETAIWLAELEQLAERDQPVEDEEQWARKLRAARGLDPDASGPHPFEPTPQPGPPSLPPTPLPDPPLPPLPSAGPSPLDFLERERDWSLPPAQAPAPAPPPPDPSCDLD
ncbi:MAG: hypothetical protein L0Y54_17105, partial [Sporichthyaceae bacterium]|nr:hypothetical protein [Sporichthyaceae bacterium]